MRSLLPLLAVLASPAAAAQQLPLVDLTDEFAAFYDRSEGQATQALAEALKAYFAPLIPGFYSSERVTFTDYDVLIGKALASYPEQRAGIADVSRRFSSMLEPARQSFEAAVGPLGEINTIYLVHSLGEMDGGTRGLGGKEHLIFGADMIAKLHGEHNIQPFFHHELFHVYHGQRFDDCGKVWCGLWSEGLATAVAAKLNPGATDAELLLVQPEPMRPVFDAHRKEAVCTVAAKLDMDIGGSGLFFGRARPSENLPPRIGYYVGYMIAAKAAEARSLNELAEMQGREVRPLIEAALRGMADCGA